MLDLVLIAAVLSAPAPRSGHALVFDDRRRALLLINGDHALGSAQGEVWAWGLSRRRRAVFSLSNASPWRRVDTSGPPPRTLAAVAYDVRRGALVMQGGIGDGDTLYGDTQEWDGTQWRTVSTEGPGVRNHHAMVFDEARGVVVLFGGQDRDITRQGDTWEWDGVSWRLAATSGPTPRVHHAMAWDGVRQRVLLYGGSSAQGTLADFWEWDGATWRPIGTFGPGARVAHRMAFHRGDGRRVRSRRQRVDVGRPDLEPLRRHHADPALAPCDGVSRRAREPRRVRRLPGRNQRQRHVGTGPRAMAAHRLTAR